MAEVNGKADISGGPDESTKASEEAGVSIAIMGEVGDSTSVNAGITTISDVVDGSRGTSDEVNDSIEHFPTFVSLSSISVALELGYSKLSNKRI